MHTHIYISLDSKAPRIQDRTIGYLITADGRDYSVERYTIVTASWQRAYLMAANEALDRFDTSVPCEITIHMPDAGITHDFNVSLKKNWQFNGWRNKKGQEIKNRDQWQKLYNMTVMANRWKVEMIYDVHRYMDYMAVGMQTAEEREL